METTKAAIAAANRYELKLEKVSETSYRVHARHGLIATVVFRESVRGAGWEVIPQAYGRTPSRKLWPTHLAALKSYFHRAVFVDMVNP